MSDKTPSFVPVRGTEAKLDLMGFNDGYVYFAADTGKIYLDYIDADGAEVKRKLLGNGAGGGEGGNAGIYYASRVITDEEKVEDNIKFALSDLNIDDYNRISTTDSRLLRRMLRDSKYRSHSATATLKMWPSVRRGEEKYIFPYQEEADVMFNSSLVYEIAVLKTYVEPLLADVGRDEPEFSEAKRLYEFLGYFLPIEKDDIPINSIIREFIGGGRFYR